MRRIPFILTGAGLLLAVLAVQGHDTAPKKKETTTTLMKKKLTQSQKVLEGIAVQDFDLIARHARELLFISKQAEFKQVLKTPLYEVYSTMFRSNAEDLIKNARKKNVDAAALAYVEMTLTCVKCHKHVREKRQARAAAFSNPSASAAGSPRAGR
jgi:hypothetical protein